MVWCPSVRIVIVLWSLGARLPYYKWRMKDAGSWVARPGLWWHCHFGSLHVASMTREITSPQGEDQETCLLEATTILDIEEKATLHSLPLPVEMQATTT